MPCYTRYVYRTVEASLANMPNTDRLVKALAADGWTVTIRHAGETVYGTHGRQRVLAGDLVVARRAGMLINVDAAGKVSLRADAGTDLDPTIEGIGRAYKRLAAIEVAARFGFRQQGEATTLADGTVRVSLRR